ncbi:hypothetical protein TEA_024121 [Camellia sinensis var. sinensis]|uniref:Uncharacterized protein n=1 Tax=Camellia sinensis var. sinensis TaxID=542762 RepID=A0A4S4E408_CAMSN|nr:hypothetical protein TEA_024121 [Camellia sinensis var. sinensis]
MINTHPDGLSDPPSDRSLFKGRIDFQLAKKTFTTTGFSNGGVGSLLETPNPTISDPGRPGGLYEKEPDGSEFLDVGLDPELSFRITFRRITQTAKEMKEERARTWLKLEDLQLKLYPVDPVEDRSSISRSKLHPVSLSRLLCLPSDRDRDRFPFSPSPCVVFPGCLPSPFSPFLLPSA